jgi:hypothetical protein
VVLFLLFDGFLFIFLRVGLFFIDISIYVKVCYLVFIKGSTFEKYDHSTGHVHWMSKLYYFFFKKDVFFSSTGPTIWKLKMSFIYKVIFIYCTSFKKMNLICELKGFLFLFFSHTINRYLTGRVNLVVKTFNF